MKRIVDLMFGITLLFIILSLAMTGYAGTSVTFEWDANTEPDLLGYKIYQSNTSGAYTLGPGNEVGTIPVGIQTITLEDLPGGIYFWVLTAFDTEGNESFPSNEVTAILDSLSPDTPSNFIITIKVIVTVEHP